MDARQPRLALDYGGARIAIAGFTTDRDPPPFTREGRIHWLLAAAAFTAIALAASDITWTGVPGVELVQTARF